MGARASFVHNVKNNMKNFLAVISLSFLVFSCATKTPPSKSSPVKEPIGASKEEVVASEEFVQGSEDIPLLVGMEKMFDEGLGFDSESGSIMSSSYETKVDLKKVRSFYSKTLPQMGWKLVKGNKNKSVFERDNEKLEVEYSKQDSKDVVKFFISSSL